MKTILLFRHGKSDWDADYNSDHERPIAKRGRKGARKIGRLLTAAKLTPDRAISSSAVRARQTLEMARRFGKWDSPVRVSDALYRADPSDLLREIQKEDDDARTLVLVGHEPTFSQTVSTLIGGGRVEMKTAACARIDFSVERWEDVRPGAGTLAFLVPPALIRPKRYLRLKDSAA